MSSTPSAHITGIAVIRGPQAICVRFIIARCPLRLYPCDRPIRLSYKCSTISLGNRGYAYSIKITKTLMLRYDQETQLLHLQIHFRL